MYVHGVRKETKDVLSATARRAGAGEGDCEGGKRAGHTLRYHADVRRAHRVPRCVQVRVHVRRADPEERQRAAEMQRALAEACGGPHSVP